jgi:D5 N terminal like
LPPPPQCAAEAIRNQGWAAVIYTTHSHTAIAPRYRIILLLAHPVAVPDQSARKADIAAVKAVAAMLELSAVLDQSKCSPDCLFYLPRHRAGSLDHWATIIDGHAFDATLLYEEHAKATGEVPKPRRSAARVAFNARHSVAELLEKYGYQRDPHSHDDWRSPFQTNDTYATHVWSDGHWSSLSGSDAEARLGQVSEDGSQRWGDAYDLFQFFEPRRDNVEPQSPEGSEDAIALEFVSKHHRELRYVADEGGWRKWDGSRWGDVPDVDVFDAIRPYMRQAALRHEGSGRQRAAARAAVVAGVERLARSDRRVAAQSSQFDADLYALSTPTGIVDLKSGAIRPCDPLALCSKVTAVLPAPSGTPAPIWQSFFGEDYEGRHRSDRLSAARRRLCAYWRR